MVYCDAAREGNAGMATMLGRLAARVRSIRPGVFALVLGACVLMIGLDGWRTWTERGVTIAVDTVETANLARSLAQHAHDVVQTADAALFTMRERVEAEGLSPARLVSLHAAMAATVANLPVIHGLFVLDAQGDRVVSSVPFGQPDTRHADRTYFRYHLAHPDRGMHLDGPVRSKVDGSWIMVVSRRLDDAGGGFAGIVMVTISDAFLQDYYRTFDVGREGSISLLSTDGIVVARQAAGPDTMGADLSGGTAFRGAMAGAPHGSFRYVSSLERIVRLGSYQRIDSYPLVVIVSHGFDELLADWRAEALRHLLVCATLAAGLAALGHRLARQVEVRQQAERRYRLLADNSSDAIVCAELDGRRVYVSPAFSKMTGWSQAEAADMAGVSLIHPEDQQRAADVRTELMEGAGHAGTRFRYLCKDGSALWVEARAQRIKDDEGEAALFVSSIRDISGQVAAEAEIAALNCELVAQANTDGLTGLANRRRFDELLDQEWRRAGREANAVSVVMIDVDRFKAYNDTLGHQQGDLCLRSVADVVARFARRPGDLVARYGGEEIVVLLPGTPAAGACDIAWSICAAIQAARLEHAGNPPFGVVTASLGVATCLPRLAEEDGGPQILVAAADAALYEAKRGGRNTVREAPRLTCHEDVAG